MMNVEWKSLKRTPGANTARCRVWIYAGTILLAMHPPSLRADVVLSDISNWNYTNTGDPTCYTSSVPDLFEATADGVRIRTNVNRGGGTMISKQAYNLAGKTVQYTWSGDGGDSFMGVVLGQTPHAWFDYPIGEESETYCVNCSYGNSWAGSWVAVPGRVYKTTVSFTSTGYTSSTVDLSTLAVVENKTGQFDYARPLHILFRNGDTYSASAAHLLLRDLRITGGVEITNVKAAQIPGTHKVKITYDLSTSASCTISVQASENGGASYGLTLPADALSGDVGAKYYNAGTRTIVLDASKVDQLKNTFTKNLRFKVVVAGAAVLAKMASIPGGTFQMSDDLDTHIIEQ